MILRQEEVKKKERETKKRRTCLLICAKLATAIDWPLDGNSAAKLFRLVYSFAIKRADVSLFLCVTRNYTNKHTHTKEKERIPENIEKS